MKLRNDLDYRAFLLAVRQCSGEVWYKTSSGDCLNLKSILSEYIFLSTTLSGKPLPEGHVECSQGEDVELLLEFLEVS